MAWQDQEWVTYVSLSLKIGLVLAVGYVAYDYFTRPSADPVEGARKEEPLHEDLYVHPLKTNITQYATASRLVGMDLWVKAGWTLTAEPGGQWLEPLEKITPTRVFERDGDMWIEFDRDGKTARLMVGSGGRIYVDDVLFAQDPREIYEHWSEESWAKVEAGEVEVGMSETQVVFALGAGSLVRASPGGATRVVEFTARQVAGLAPVRVTFREGRAESIEPIEGSGR
jgi:hypothetical protein